MNLNTESKRKLREMAAGDLLTAFEAQDDVVSMSLSVSRKRRMPGPNGPGYSPWVASCAEPRALCGWQGLLGRSQDDVEADPGPLFIIQIPSVRGLRPRGNLLEVLDQGLLHAEDGIGFQ